MAGRILHKNMRLRAKVCPRVPLGTPRPQTAFSAMSLASNWWGNMAEACLPTATLSQMFEAKPVSAVLQNIILKLLQKVQNSVKCQNPVKERF